MQDRTYIEEALESARTKLQPGERILTVGRPVVSFAFPFTRYAWTRFSVISAIAFSFMLLINVSALELLAGTLVISCIYVLEILFVGCLLCPIIDLIRNAMKSCNEEICVITTQRFFAVQFESCHFTELARKADIAKFQSEKERLTLTMSDGSKKKMKVIEGLRLVDLPTL